MKYWYIFTKSFKSQMIYKNAAILKFFGSGLELIVAVNLWGALLSSGVKTGITLQDMLLFVLINILIAELTHANIAVELEPQIRSGAVSMELLKPFSFKYYCISTVLGKNAYYFIVSALPSTILITVFLDMNATNIMYTILPFILSVILGMLIVFELSYIVGLLAFFTQKAWYLDWYLSAGKLIFGGTMVPIWFYPKWLNQISFYLPFRYITFEPINIALGKTSFAPPSTIICIALSWIAALALLGQLVYRQVEKRITINGG